MNKFKKGIINILKNIGSKTSKKNEKFGNRVLNLSLQKIDSDCLKFDGKAVYTADMSTLVYVFNTNDNFTIPEGVEIIGKMAFNQRRHLKSVDIPSTVKVIEKEAFFGCDELDNICIPATVEKVKAYAFADCYSLKTVTFEGTLKHLSRNTFDDCDNLHTIVVPSGKKKTYRKYLRMNNDDAELIIFEKEMNQVAETKAAAPKATEKTGEKKTVDTPKKKPATKVSQPAKTEVAKTKTVAGKSTTAKPKAVAEKSTTAKPKADVTKTIETKPKTEDAKPSEDNSEKGK
ncbi:MAG: leucine-rich repeat protein [Prevotella sp.]|nr:leucine-rich repeat protein [Prevotella sp.]